MPFARSSFCIGLNPFSLNLIFYEGACGGFSCELYEMLTQLCKSLLSENILSSGADGLTQRS
jgi:hypothetical protein